MDITHNLDVLAKLNEAWAAGRQRFAEVLFKVMLTEGLLHSDDYDDQIAGAQAAGLIAGLSRGVVEALEGAQAYKDPSGERAAELLREATPGSVQPEWVYDPKRDDFAVWIFRHTTR